MTPEIKDAMDELISIRVQNKGETEEEAMENIKKIFEGLVDMMKPLEEVDS